MSTITLTGVILEIFADQKFSDRFSKRQFWLQENKTQSPATYCLELWNYDANKILAFSKNEMVECEVAVLGKMVNTKRDNSMIVINILRCLEIKKI